MLLCDFVHGIYILLLAQQVLYQVLHTGAEFDEAISCYEYLGKFYVRDGMKRVSVSMYAGIPTMKAHVIRILPVKTEDPKNQSYYEFVKNIEKTGLYQIAFTQTGKVDGSLTALGYNPEHVWNESDRYSFIFHWYPFERAPKRTFDGNLDITTVDALDVLLKKHSYVELRDMPSWTLAELMRESWVEKYRIVDPEFKINAR